MSLVEVGNTILIRKIGKITPTLLRLRFDLCIPRQTITTDTTDFKSHKLDEQAKMVKKNSTLLSFPISTQKDYHL